MRFCRYPGFRFLVASDLTLPAPLPFRTLSHPFRRLPFRLCHQFAGTGARPRQPGTFAEIRRVLKAGGIRLHAFPSRHTPIEPHVRIPLATVVQSQTWLNLWALLGIRSPFQRGKSAREVTSLNYNYLHDQTNYLTRQEFLHHASIFSESAFRERDLFLPLEGDSHVSPSLKKRLAVGFLGTNLVELIYGTLFMRTLYLKK